jgi:hypothetical protein
MTCGSSDSEAALPASEFNIGQLHWLSWKWGIPQLLIRDLAVDIRTLLQRAQMRRLPDVR